ncbi:MAG: hypothetical protein WD851_02820 [Pirellulales bacterium]
MNAIQDAGQDSIETVALNWLKQTAARIENVPRVDVRNSCGRQIGSSVFNTNAVCEGTGLAIAELCLETLGYAVPHWIEEAENALAELSGETVGNPQKHEKFQLELSALVFVMFRIAIDFFGPEEKAKRARVFQAFDRGTSQQLNQKFLELTDRRGSCYSKQLEPTLKKRISAMI